MPIKSYLAFPKNGQKHLLERELKNIPACEVVQAKNRDVLVIVSETANQQEEDKLLEQLHKLDSLDHLNLVAGFSDENINQ